MTNATRSDSDLAIVEVAAAVRSVSDEQLDAIAQDILQARVVACQGAGREGLMIKGLTMRLFHAGIDAHSIGEMTCPAVGPGDLVILSGGPGNLKTIEAIAEVAKRAGARLLYFTAEASQPPAQLADHVVVIQAQTMASDGGSEAVLPMGSAYEIGLLVIIDLITNRVRAGRGEALELMRGRHTNLE